MPSYELNLIVRTLTKPECKEVLKRAAVSIFEEGGILRKIENLGLAKELPIRMKKDNVHYRIGSYFLYKFHGHPKSVTELREIYDRDVDIIRSYIAMVTELSQVECTLHEELLPPAYRPEVQEMVAIAARKERSNRYKKFDLHVEHYPFQ